MPLKLKTEINVKTSFDINRHKDLLLAEAYEKLLTLFKQERSQDNSLPVAVEDAVLIKTKGSKNEY